MDHLVDVGIRPRPCDRAAVAWIHRRELRQPHQGPEAHATQASPAPLTRGVLHAQGVPNLVLHAFESFEGADPWATGVPGVPSGFVPDDVVLGGGADRRIERHVEESIGEATRRRADAGGAVAAHASPTARVGRDDGDELLRGQAVVEVGLHPGGADTVVKVADGSGG